MSAQQLGEEFRKNPNLFIELNQRYFKLLNAKRESLDSIRKIIIEEIENEHIKAVGYVVGGSIDALPVEVPIRFFSNSIISWETDCISAPPFKFQQVRLVDLPMTDFSVHPVKKIGRPSVAEAIRAAVIALDRSDPNFRNLGRKVQCERIIKFMKNISGDAKSHKTPSERTIKN